MKGYIIKYILEKQILAAVLLRQVRGERIYA